MRGHVGGYYTSRPFFVFSTKGKIIDEEKVSGVSSKVSLGRSPHPDNQPKDDVSSRPKKTKNFERGRNDPASTS